MSSASQLLHAALGAPTVPECDDRIPFACWVCGASSTRGMPRVRWMGVTFVGQNRVRAPESGLVCEACVCVMAGKPPDTWRMYSVLYADGKYQDHGEDEDQRQQTDEGEQGRTRHREGRQGRIFGWWRRGRRTVSALRAEDRVWATLAIHKRRVEAALDVIRRAAAIGPIGVSYSGGKDSQCIVDLVRQVVPDAPIAFFDSGCELPSTYKMVAHVGAETIAPRMTMQEMARYAGWWDYATPVDYGCEFDAKRVVIEEPSEAFVVRRGLRVICHGVRAAESGGRRKHVAMRGPLYQGADRTWYCMPLARWETADVWAYIASRGLRYNAAYDAMTDARVERESQRVSTLLGDRGSGWGRHAILRQFAPEQWRALVAEFPGLARAT